MIARITRRSSDWVLRCTWEHPPHREELGLSTYAEAKKCLAFLEDLEEGNEQIQWVRRFSEAGRLARKEKS